MILILSFYGAGFATVPAYLGAIHGRLLTAWSAAGVLGPVIVNAIADSQEGAGASFSIMIGLLVVGFVCNELIRPVNAKFHEPEADRSTPTTAGAQA